MRIIINAFFYIFSVGSLFSQEKPLISLSMTFEKSKMFFLEPWVIDIEVKNDGINSVRLSYLSATQGRWNQSGFLDLEFKGDKDTIWKSTGQIINNYELSEYTGDNIKNSMELQPGQSFHQVYTLPPLLPPGSMSEINIRAAYIPQYSYVYSPVQSIHLEPYGKNDNAAFQYLKTLPRPVFFLQPFCAVPYDLADIEYAEHLIKTFPESRFVLYCQLFLARAYNGMAYNAGKKKEFNQLIEYLKKSQYYALVVYHCGNPEFAKKAEDVLKNMLDAYYNTFFNSDPENPEILNTFIYPPKN